MISFPFCIREGKAHLRCYKKAGIYTSIWNTCKSKTGWDRNLTDSCGGAGDSNQKLCGKALWDLMSNQEGECLMRIVGLLAILEEVGVWRLSKAGLSLIAAEWNSLCIARLVWLMQNLFLLLCRWAPATQWQAVSDYPDVHSRGRFLVGPFSRWCVTGPCLSTHPLPPVHQELKIHSGSK